MKKQLIQANSPTCSKEAIQLISTLLASKGWVCSSIDVKTAFLQGKETDRDIFIEPPPECEKQNAIWKLNLYVNVYVHMNDASRTWYFRVKEEPELLKLKWSLNELALFYWHYDGTIQVLITILVDDLFWGGTEVFKKKLIVPFKHMFETSKENSKCFKHLGLQIQQLSECITVDQIKYCKSWKPNEISKERRTQ